MLPKVTDTQMEDTTMKLVKRILNAYIRTAGNYPLPMSWTV